MQTSSSLSYPLNHTPRPIEEVILRCSDAQRDTLSTALAMHCLLLNQNDTKLNDVCQKHIPAFTEVSLQRCLHYVIDSLTPDHTHKQRAVTHLHAAFDFETPHGITLSKSVSLTALSSLELAMIFAMGQFDRLAHWLTSQHITFSDNALDDLIREAKKAPFGHLGPMAPLLGRRAYEISKVLQQFWSEDKPRYSVERDGLLVRYTQDPEPRCFARMTLPVDDTM